MLHSCCWTSLIIIKWIFINLSVKIYSLMTIVRINLDWITAKHSGFNTYIACFGYKCSISFLFLYRLVLQMFSLNLSFLNPQLKHQEHCLYTYFTKIWRTFDAVVFDLLTSIFFLFEYRLTLRHTSFDLSCQDNIFEYQQRCKKCDP